MSGELTFGMRLTYDGKGAAAALDETRAKIDGLSSSSSKLTSQYTGLTQGVKQHGTEVAVAGRAADAYAASTAKAAMSAGQLRMATRQLPMQFTDIVTALAAGQPPMMVLLQQGGQLKDTFGGIGPAAKAMGGYILGMLNPVTLAVGGVAAALAAGVMAWNRWGTAAIESAGGVMTAVRAAHDDARRLGAMSGEAARDEIAHLEALNATYTAYAADVAAKRDRFNWRSSHDQLVAYDAEMEKNRMRIALLRAQETAQGERDYARAIDETNRALGNIDPIVRATLEWERLLDLQKRSRGQLTAGQMGALYADAMGGVEGKPKPAGGKPPAPKPAGDDRTDAERSFADAWEETQRILQNTDPQAKANAEWERMVYLQETLGEDVFPMTAEQMGAAYLKAMGGMEAETKDTAATLSKTWENFRDNTQSVFGDQLYDAMTGKLTSIEDAFKQMLMRMAANAAAQGLTDALFGGNGKSGKESDGLIGGLMNWLASADGNAFTGGGVAAFASGGAFSNGLYDKPTPFKFASGGGFSLGVMGEAGPEAVMPLARDSAGKLGVRAQGGGSQVVINDNTVINVDSRADRAQVLEDVSRVVDARQNQLVDRLKREGALA